jgi:hypothetical protein
MRTTYAPDITKVIDGVEYVAKVCMKCQGRGYLPGYEYIDNARCWSCDAHRGPVDWVKRSTFDAYERRTARLAEKARREAEAAEARFAAEKATWNETNSDLRDALARYFERGPRDLMRYAAELAEYGILSDEDTTKARAAIAREAERQAALVDVPEGRQVVEGRVRSVKVIESAYGSTLKMLVETDAGYRVFGSVPTSLYDVEPGAVVRFTATLTPKERGFGFYSRPTKAAIV